MATANLTVSPTSGGAISTWSGYESGYGDVRYTTPTTDGFYCTVSIPAALRGATFNAVTLTFSGSGNSGSTYRRYRGTSTSVTDANLLEKLQNGEDNIQIYFSFRASAGGGIGSHSATYEWSNISVSVDYTPAAAITGTISLGTSSTVAYATDCKSLCGDETAKLTLTIEPDAAITAVTLDLGDSVHSAYDSFTQNIAIASGGSGDVEITLALDDATLASRVNSAYVRVTLTTASGSEVSTWTEISGLKLLSSRVAPSISAAFSDTAGYYTTFSAYLQSMSHLAAALTVTLDTSADSDIGIRSRSIAIGGNTYSSGSNAIDIGAVNASGSVSYTITVTDSYGQTGTKTGTLTFIAYAQPYFTALSLERYNSTSMELDDTSDSVWLNASGAVASLNSANAWTLTATYTNGTISGTVNIASGTDGAAISYTKSTSAFSQALSAAYEWEVTFTLADQLSSVSYTLTVPKSGGIFSIEKYGVAVGKRSTGSSSESKFEVSYNAYFTAYIRDDYGTALLTGDNSAWQTLTLESGVEQDTDFHTCAVRKIGEVVYLRGAVKLTSQFPSSATNSKLLTTLPSGYRPNKKVLLNAGPKINVMSIEVDTNGDVKLWNRVGSALGTNEPVSLNGEYFI